MRFTREQVAKCYDEIDRRMGFERGSSRELRETRADMTQGLYGCLMAIASNWPEVRAMCDSEEAERGWYFI